MGICLKSLLLCSCVLALTILFAFRGDGGRGDDLAESGPRPFPVQPTAPAEAEAAPGLPLPDLRAPPGFMWRPFGLSVPPGCKNEGCEDLYVNFCLLNYSAYQSEPWKYPLEPMLAKLSRCGKGGSGTDRTYPLSALRRLMDSNPTAFMDPSGFIFHETRCGSTLASNMLAHVPTNIVISEGGAPLAAVMRGSTHRDGGTRLIRDVLRLMSPASGGYTHAFFKFQSSLHARELTAAFPTVPWVYLFREPVDVLASNLEGAWGKQAMRAQAAATGNKRRFVTPCLSGAGLNRELQMFQPTTQAATKAEKCAAHLYVLCGIALEVLRRSRAAGAGEAAGAQAGRGLLVEYSGLPEVMTDHIYPKHFGMEQLMGSHLPYLVEASRVYSKSMLNNASEFEVGTDLAYKATQITEEMRAAASRMGMVDQFQQMRKLQEWVKPNADAPAR